MFYGQKPSYFEVYFLQQFIDSRQSKISLTGWMPHKVDHPSLAHILNPNSPFLPHSPTSKIYTLARCSLMLWVSVFTKKIREASKLSMRLRISVLQKRTRTRTNEASKWDYVGKVTKQIIGLIS